MSGHWLNNIYILGDNVIEKSNWTSEEFKLFLLIYASQTNFIETEEELDFIESRFNIESINKMRKEINQLNDFQKSKIIINHIKSNNYKQNELDGMLSDIKELYNTDGVYDSKEKLVFSMLERLLKVN